MSQTDRQTDKSTWWEVTGYGDNITRLESLSTYPSFVKKVWGGREACPTTKREHFQGCIQCNGQQRKSAFKDWLPGVHLEVARQKDALIKYSMKEDTATGDKLERVNPTRFYSADEILVLIAKQVIDCYTETQYHGPDGRKLLYNKSINLLLTEQPRLAGQLMNPSLRNFFADTYMVWINLAILQISDEEEALRGDDEISHV